jgi:two-component system NtrC family response regulator
MVAHCAASDVNVLITGETGTGKELFARAIHANSARAEAPFVVVDCTALPETLVESLLLGFSRGAFTGAEEDKQGLVLQADQGTLLLDEVGELAPALQKTFLRVLEERRVRPLGGRQEVASDFRLVAATHRNLEQMVARSAFRSDLFFRIQSVGITLPALRERTADIRPIATHHLQEICRRLQLEQKGISEAFFETLEAYRWPGNVRELVNVLEQAVLMARHDPTLYPVHLPGKIRVEVTEAALSTPCARSEETGVFQPNASRGHTLQEFREMACAHAEEQYLKDVLAACRGDVKQALRISGLSQSRLYALLKKYHLTPAR